MISVKQIYGLTVERGLAEERHVHEITSYIETIDRVAAPGVYVVEFLPWLMHLPTWLAPFKREAKALVQRHWDYMAPLVRQKTTEEAPESFVRRYLKSKEEWGLTDREIVWVLSSIYGGASGTSATAMQTIILNMCLFPEWQHRMQEELEQAAGQRLPIFEDSSSLPTVRAIIKESMRWRPALSGGMSCHKRKLGPLLTSAGFPHAVIKDDLYEGYFIPKGAVLIPNQWAIFRDEQLYPDPDQFSTREVVEISLSHVSRTSHNIPEPQKIRSIRARAADLSRSRDDREGFAFTSLNFVLGVQCREGEGRGWWGD